MRLPMKPSQTPETETWRKFLRQTVGVDLDQNYRPLRNEANKFWQDRNAMKAGNFTGITGFPNQDVAMWLTMGAIADRTHDRLGASDLAIVEFRKQMLEAVQAFDQGAPAMHRAAGGHAGRLLLPGHRPQDDRLAHLRDPLCLAGRRKPSRVRTLLFREVLIP